MRLTAQKGKAPMPTSSAPKTKKMKRKKSFGALLRTWEIKSSQQKQVCFEHVFPENVLKTRAVLIRFAQKQSLEHISNIASQHWSWS